VPGMIDTWLCRWYPGGLLVGVTRDTRRNRSVPGEIHSQDTWRTRRVPGGVFRGSVIRETRGALGGFREGSICLGIRGHVTCSDGWSEGGFERGFSVGFGKAPKGFLGRASGTRGTLRRAPKGVFRGGMSRRGFRRGSSGMAFVVGLGIDGWVDEICRGGVFFS